MLDLRTVYFVCAATCVVLSCLQLVVFFAGRLGRWPLWWGLSNLALGIATFLVAFRGHIADWLSIDAGNTLSIAGYLMMLISMRSLVGKRVRFRPWIWLTAALCLILIFALDHSSQTATRLTYVSLICMSCDIAMIIEAQRLGRRERLMSAWLLVALYAPTSVLFAVRAIMASYDQLGGPDLFAQNTGIHSWLAMYAMIFIVLRSIAVVLVAAERSQRQLTEVAHHDALTGALNRAGFARATSSLPAGDHAMLLVDIDHFKQLNDRHGHSVGDRVLQLFVEAARSRLKPQDLLSRQGGDEFLILLLDRNQKAASDIANEIRIAFALLSGRSPELDTVPTISVGVAELTQGKAISCVTRNADTALYSSKERGRDKVVVFGEEFQAA